MSDWVRDVHEMHAKFGFVEAVDKMKTEELVEYLRFRIRFLEEELAELRSAETPEDAVDALIDLCAVAIGTLDTFRIDANAAWRLVHEANMAKERGTNEKRTARFGVPDLIKPKGWRPPNHFGNVGLIGSVFDHCKNVPLKEQS